MNKEHIGVYEFARRTKRDVTSLYKLIYAGKLAAIKVGDGKRKVWQIAEALVTQWEQKQ